MRHCPSHPARRARGFTLVEMIMVIVIVGIAGVGISSMQGSLFANAATVKDLQVRTPLMQACAEQVLAVRRFTQDGYAAVNSGAFGTNACGAGFTSMAGYPVPSVNIASYTGSACPSGGTCKLVVITQGGMTPLTLMLADY